MQDDDTIPRDSEQKAKSCLNMDAKKEQPPKCKSDERNEHHNGKPSERQTANREYVKGEETMTKVEEITKPYKVMLRPAHHPYRTATDPSTPNDRIFAVRHSHYSAA